MNVQSIKLRILLRKYSTQWHFSYLELMFYILNFVLRLLLSIFFINQYSFKNKQYHFIDIILFKSSAQIYSLSLNYFHNKNKSQMSSSRKNSAYQKNQEQKVTGTKSNDFSQFAEKKNLDSPQNSSFINMSSSSSKQKVKTNNLLQNLSKAQTVHKQNDSEKRINSHQARKNVTLNMMRLQDKNFNIEKNIFNISIGQIANRQTYLSNLQEQLQLLKSKIQTLEEQENKKIKMRTISYANQQSDTFSQEQSRSRNQPRRSLCGRIYNRASTPNTEKKHLKKISKDQQSSFYKWKPQIAERPVSDFSQIEKQGQESSNKYQVGDQHNKSLSNYRIKQKNIKQPVQNINKEQIIQEVPHQFKEIFKKNPQWEINSINDDFRAKMTKKIQIPKNFPIEALDITDTLEQYEKKSAQIYALFGIDSSKFKSKLIVRKFKNGVYYQMKPNKNIVWYFNGSFYIGDWDTDLPSESQKNGFGFQYVPNKYYYLGQFRNGNRNGKGIIKIINKGKQKSSQFVSYDGQWLNGKPHGQGKHIDQKNNKYIGTFQFGEKTGKGIVLNSDGLYYEGEMKNGSKNGKGVQKLINGDIYIGGFLEGKFHGNGTYKWKNGSYYQGQFAYGKRQGKGIWKSYNGDQFEGQYSNDAKNGWGKFTWKNGEIYQGEFKNDVRHGKGFYKHPKGKIGKYVWKDGHIDHRLQQQQQQQTTKNEQQKQKIAKNEIEKAQV